jgi:hypothetical protein
MATKTGARGWDWRRAVAVMTLAGALIAPSLALAGEGDPPLPAEKAPKTADKPKAPAAPALTCTLLTAEAPRGGRLEVEGAGFGKAPLVRIGGRVTRMIERTESKIAVQIHADSDGGPVTVHAGKVQATCGTLTIIGKNG